MKKSFFLNLILASILGILIGWIDSSPNWDDTGVSIFLILLAGLICGFLTAQKPWLIALAVSIWIPFFSMLCTQNYGAFIAIIPGFIGAFAGYFLREIVNP